MHAPAACRPDTVVDFSIEWGRYTLCLVPGSLTFTYRYAISYAISSAYILTK